MRRWGSMATRSVSLGLGIAVGAGIRDVVGALSGFVMVLPVPPSPLLVPLSLQLLGDFVFHRFLKGCSEGFTEFVGWGRRSAKVRFAVAMTCGSDEFIYGILPAERDVEVGICSGGEGKGCGEVWVCMRVGERTRGGMAGAATHCVSG